MALETLKGLKEINGEKVFHVHCTEDLEDLQSKQFEFSIVADHETNCVAFKIQNGPIKKSGKNGCQVVDIIAVAKHMIEKLNENFPCEENAMTVKHLGDALDWQGIRTKNRESRGVEGTNIL